MKNNTSCRLSAFVALIAFSSGSFAHTGLLPVNGLADGFVHPLAGLDHLLVMSGLGLWAGIQSNAYGKSLLGVFLVSMLAGALLAINGIAFAHIETVILFSVAFIALLQFAPRLKLPQLLGLPLVCGIALMHGQAHGLEMPQASTAFLYASGFVVASALLTAFGLFSGRLLHQYKADYLLRIHASLSAVWLLSAL